MPSSLHIIPSRVLELAERIVSAANREHPADAILREELRVQRGLTSAETAQISSLVFAYFRWHGWLRSGQPQRATHQESGIREGLRQASELAARFERQPESFSDEELVERSLPAWLKGEMKITSAFARALQAKPKLWLRARAGQGPVLGKRLGNCVSFGKGRLADALEYRGRLDLFRTPEFQQGQFEVQDLSSQAVALVCEPHPGEVWWDACAGEGGKLLHLSELMQNKGLIWASDRARWRLERLKRRAARARVFNYRIAEWAGGARLPTKTRFDGVLVDAPCSGVGTWQRNPHARWTTTAADVKELSQVQKQLLVNAAQGVKVGGKLIYAACTLTRSETLGVIEAFDEQQRDWEPLEFPIPLLPATATHRDLLIWPQDFGGNGMFLAAWRRKR